jgi:hypothetical protein
MSAGDSSQKSSEMSSYRRFIAIAVIIALVLGFLTYATRPTPATQPATITIQITCMTTYPGQPLGAALRVVNATNLEPVAGAIVTATAPVSGICGASTPMVDTVQFTTNSTEWYSLPFINHGTYQIGVTYLGHSYSVIMRLGLSVYNCATLYVPTGQTNVTTTGASQMPCQSIG